VADGVGDWCEVRSPPWYRNWAHLVEDLERAAGNPDGRHGLNHPFPVDDEVFRGLDFDRFFFAPSPHLLGKTLDVRKWHWEWCERYRRSFDSWRGGRGLWAGCSWSEALELAAKRVPSGDRMYVPEHLSPGRRMGE